MNKVINQFFLVTVICAQYYLRIIHSDLLTTVLLLCSVCLALISRYYRIAGNFFGVKLSRNDNIFEDRHATLTIGHTPTILTTPPAGEIWTATVREELPCHGVRGSFLLPFAEQK